MPYENEHACRLRSPDDFQQASFRRITRRSGGKEYSIIVGRPQGATTMTEQAYRYDRKTWAAAQAREHCRDHGGRFEEAAGEE